MTFASESCLNSECKREFEFQKVLRSDYANLTDLVTSLLMKFPTEKRKKSRYESVILKRTVSDSVILKDSGKKTGWVIASSLESRFGLSFGFDSQIALLKLKSTDS